ncbi:MAG: hypothetical protein E6860_15785 [Clostridium sp.]|uniref:hypothetical protein n=1 Tax=Clostridium sp. TaxID=1506 RepID=UPI0029042715|nr:hypothetical protein [Clostridium sp.]MDU1586996.1 hypothetical protein [Clostridium sp.]
MEFIHKLLSNKISEFISYFDKSLILIMIIISVLIFIVSNIKIKSKRSKIIISVTSTFLMFSFFFCGYLIFSGLPIFIKNFIISMIASIVILVIGILLYLLMLN